jgi:outer membrane protein TolC
MESKSIGRSRLRLLGPVLGLLGLAALRADDTAPPFTRNGLRAPATREEKPASPTLLQPAATPSPSIAVSEPPAIDLPPLPAGFNSPVPSSPSAQPITPPPSRVLDLRTRTARPIYPINLAGALRLAGARDLDIAIARERIAKAVADLAGARVLWLPSFFIGPSWARHDGQIQDNKGNVFTTSRSSFFIGGNASAGGAVYATPPGGGTAPGLSSLSAVLRISDAIFEPMAARQIVAARNANLTTTANDTLLELTEAYFDLQQAAGRVAIAREALDNAEALVDLTAAYVESGKGLEADHRRSLTERDRRKQDLADAVGQWKVASAELVRRTRLDPRIVVAPVEPPEAVIRMVPPDCPLDDLIVLGLRSRPELAEAQALVQATLIRLKQARLRPLVPSLAVRFAAGGFGGGVNSFFGDFNGRQDTDAQLYWELQNFGLGDRAIIRGRAAEQRAAVFAQIKLQDRVAAEVVAAYEAITAAEERFQEAGRALPEALRSLSLNLDNIRQGAGLPGGTLPIEVLQPIQALAQARTNYLDAVLALNRAQSRLYRAVGRPPTLPGPSLPPPPGPEPLLAPGPVFHAPVKFHVPGGHDRNAR